MGGVEVGVGDDEGGASALGGDLVGCETVLEGKEGRGKGRTYEVD